jgi:hypothetical protein
MLALVSAALAQPPEDKGLKPEDEDGVHHVTQVLATISAFMSVCGSLYIIGSYWQSIQNLKVSSASMSQVVLVAPELFCSLRFTLFFVREGRGPARAAYV